MNGGGGGLLYKMQYVDLQERTPMQIKPWKCSQCFHSHLKVSQQLHNTAKDFFTEN